jgi:MoaA/NifB/PqqE/SkfB family radical SAM enzyme
MDLSIEKIAVGTNHLSKWAGCRLGEALDRPGLARPQMICTILTSRCNFGCGFCNHPKLTHVDEMPLDWWKRTLLDLKRWLGVYRINFLGGEPLLYRDLDQLLAFCRAEGILAGLTTNGSLLTEERIRALAPHGLFNVSVSMDAARPELHDRLRGFPGSHDRIMAALPLLKRWMPTTRVALRTNVLAENLDDLVPLAHLVRRLDLHAIGYQPVEYRNLDADREAAYRQGAGAVPDARLTGFHAEHGALPPNMAGHWVGDLDRLDANIEALRALKRQGWPILNSDFFLACIAGYYRSSELIYRIGRSCRTAWEQLVILPDGKVRSCTELPPFGDLTHQTPQEAWCSPKAAEHRRLCARCERTCMNLFHWKRSLPEKAELFARFY